MTDSITIRHSTEADRARVRALAELDARPAPAGATLLAEVGGRLWAEQERVMRGPGPLVGRLMSVRQRAGALA